MSQVEAARLTVPPFVKSWKRPMSAATNEAVTSASQTVYASTGTLTATNLSVAQSESVAAIAFTNTPAISLAALVLVAAINLLELQATKQFAAIAVEAVTG